MFAWAYLKTMNELKVLVVDDDDLKRILLVEIAELCGLEITETDCGKKATDLVLNEKFDIVLLDFFLKDCTGDQVLADILATKPRAELPYFVLASSDNDKCKNFQKMGFDRCLEPPFEYGSLERIVQELA